VGRESGGAQPDNMMLVKAKRVSVRMELRGESVWTELRGERVRTELSGA
jgi:hypothetical protein